MPGLDELTLLRGLVSDIASSPLVRDDYTEGNETLNDLIQTVRAFATSRGITWSDPENDV